MKKKYIQNHEEGECEHAPIRGSFVILVAKLLVTFLLFELIYAAIYYFLTLGFALPFNLHHHIAILILVLEILKVIMQTFFTLYVSLSWTSNVYHINGKHLVKRTGIFNSEEDIYEFDTVRSVAVNQSWLGRLFHYGDITLKTSASGGYQVIVTMDGVSNPQKYEQTIKQCL